MSEYYVRVNMSSPFVRDRLKDCGNMLDDMPKKLPPEMKAEQIWRRFSFSLFKVTADSKRDVKNAFEAAWGELYPDHPDAMRLMITPVTDDTVDLMKSVYTGYFGVDPYLELCTELTDSIPLLRERGALRALRLQNYLFAIDGGNGFTTLLSSFSDFLTRMHVFDDCDGTRSRYMEIRMTLADDNKLGCYTVDNTIASVRENSKGEETVISAFGFDISCFLDGNKFDELRSFVQRLYDYQNDFIFIFRVPFLEKSALDRVAEILSDVMLVRTVEIPPVDDVALFEGFWGMLDSLGYKKTSKLDDAFFRKVAAEKKDGRFYGYKSVRKIVSEMALLKSAHDADGENGLIDGAVTRDVMDVGDLSGDFVEEKKEKTGYDELAEMIGMEKITERIREIVMQVKTSMKDDSLDRPSIHMRFLGAPGTGKTTVARIIGRIFREEGILRKGGFFEYTARSLCAEYVGQTAVKTAAICRDAYGSVLFIDEAYSLYEGNDTSRNDYGREVLTTLISEMENHRDDMLVIMAGYTDEMETLMKGNTGLRSRMPYAITFPSYTREQLYEIFMLMIRKHFRFDESLAEEAKKFFLALSENYVNSREFGNARFVRNLYERTWSKGALRTSLAGEPSIVLTRDDFVSASSEKEFSENLQKDKAPIGF